MAYFLIRTPQEAKKKMYELEEEVKYLTPESRKLLESRLLKIRLLLHFTKYKEN